MTEEEIKTEVQMIYCQIQVAQERLKEIRSICEHKNTFKGNYSYRVGCIDPATICADCGEVIKVHFGNEINRS